MSDVDQVDEHPDVRREAQRGWWIAGIALAAVIGVVTALVLASGGDGDDRTDAGAAGTTSVSSPSETADPADPGSTVTADPASTIPGSTGGSVPGPDASGSTVPATIPPVDPAVTVPVVTGTLDTVVVETVVPAPPVSIDETADTGTGMSFRIESLEAVQGEANGPGEIAAPSVRVTVVATNGGTTPVLLETAVVDLRYGPDRIPAPLLSGPDAVRFSGSLAPGASATAAYVFDVPVDQRDLVSVFVSYQASVPPVLFEGPAPRPAA